MTDTEAVAPAVCTALLMQDNFRKIIVELLQEKESLKRHDIMESASQQVIRRLRILRHVSLHAHHARRKKDVITSRC